MPTFEPFFSSPFHYGLTYLTQEINTLMNEGMYLYDNAFYLNHRFQIKKPTCFLSSLVNKKIKTNSSALLKTYITDLENFNTLFAYIERQKIFNDEKLWHKWQNYFNKPEDKKFLIRLHKDWQEQSKFSPYSNETLFEAANILSELATHTKQAKRELKQCGHFLKEEIYTAYRDYLNKLKHRITIEENSISKAMCQRLELANQSHDMCSDVIFNLEQQLNKLDITLTTKNHIPQPQPSLTAQKLTEFAYYIKTYGNDDTQQRLETISWFNPHYSLPLCAHKMDNNFLLIPQCLQKLTPQKMKKPSWFFRGHNQRCTFFQTESDFLLELNSLESLCTQAVHDENLLSNNLWQHLSRLENTLVEKIAHINAKTNTHKLFNYFRTQIQTFFKQWQLELNKHLSLVFNKKLDFIAHLLPSTSPLSHLMEECFFSESTKQSLIQMLTDTKHNIRKASLTEKSIIEKRLRKLEKRLNVIIKEDEKILALREEKALISKILSAIAANDYSINNDHELVINYYKNLTEEQQKIFLDIHKIQINSIKENLLSFLKLEIIVPNDTEFMTKNHLLALSVRLLYQFDYVFTKQVLSQNLPLLLNRYENHIQKLSYDFLYQKREEFWQFNILLGKIMPVECHAQFKLIIETLCIKSDPLSSAEIPIQGLSDPKPTLQAQAKLSCISHALDNLISASPVAKTQAYSSYATLIKNPITQNEMMPSTTTISQMAA